MTTSTLPVSEIYLFLTQHVASNDDLFLSLTIEADKPFPTSGGGGLVFSKRNTVYQLHVPPLCYIIYNDPRVAFTRMRPTRHFSGILRSCPTKLRATILLRGMVVISEISSIKVSVG